MNHIENVTVIEAAVSDKCGVVLFDEGPSHYMGHISPNGKLQVKTVAIDDLVAKGELPVPDYIKMDIEGAEMLALLGAQSTLAKRHPTLFLATHGRGVHRKAVTFLQSLSYQIEPIDGMDLEQSSELLVYYREAD